MENFVITIACLLIGILIRRLPQFPPESGRAFNMFVIYISLPPLVLLKVSSLSFSGDLIVPAIMPWAMLAVSALTVLFLARIFGWKREITGSLLLLVPMGNTSFLGIPMVRAFFGEQAVSYAVLYDQLGSFLCLATYGSLILALYGDSAARPTVRSVLLRIITFPPFIAFILALAFRSAAYPLVLRTFLETLASTLVPVVMIAVGFQLTFRLEREVMAPLGIGLCLKLVAAPVLALLICRVFGLDSEAARVAVFEAGMPPMVSAGALAIIAGLSPALTAALVGLGIPLSFLTLPLLYRLLV